MTKHYLIILMPVAVTLFGIALASYWSRTGPRYSSEDAKKLALLENRKRTIREAEDYYSTVYRDGDGKMVRREAYRSPETGITYIETTRMP